MGRACRVRSAGGRRAAIALALLGAALPARAEVEIVKASVEGRALGLAAGDRLRAWRDPARSAESWTPIASWRDPWFLDFVEIPRRPRIELEVERAGSRRIVTTASRPLELEVAPLLAPEVAAAIEQRIAVPTPEADGRAAAIAALRDSLRDAGPDVGSWALLRYSQQAAGRSDLETALAAMLAAAEASPAPFSGELLRRAGELQIRLGRAADADATYSRALEIWRADDPDGVGVSVVLNAIGNLRGRQHRLAEARRLISAACDLRRRQAPASWLVANCLNNLGILAGRRNDLAEAESSFVAALAIDRELGRDSAPMLSNLGVVARLRGDLERAERYVEEGIALYERQGDLAQAIAKKVNLANIVGDRGDAERALAIFDRVLDVDLPRSPDHALELQARLNRAIVLDRLGRPDAAEADLDLARGLLGASYATTTDGANLAQTRAEIVFDRGELPRAAALCEESLTMQVRLRPDTSYEANAASLCARIAAARAEWERADALFVRSIRALERQQQRVGGGERGLVAFREKFRPIYGSYIDYLVGRGRAAEALELLERYRAQALRALMNQRDLTLAGRAPAGLAAERDRLGVEIESAYGKLAKLAAETSERDTLRAEIDQLHRRREELAVQIRAAAPALARAEAPAALAIAELSPALPEGTLALVYQLGESTGRLFVLDGAGTVEVHPLATPVGELESDVARWLAEVVRPRPDPALDRIAGRLSEALLAPAASRLARAKRLLIVPDGALHALSFAALPPPRGAADAGRYLVEGFAVSRDVSLSVHAATLEADASLATRHRQVAIFGDPVASTEAASRFRAELGALPASRGEATAIGEIFGARSRLFLGDQATERAARAVLPEADVAHFACHAVVDERLPLDSALVLSPEGGSGGLLQAWEIAEELALDGALVVLSACDTARGGERGGEGIVGLVRALQVAGAGTVVASLWRIGDESTAELMKRFYRHLAAGVDRDEALRRAQLELLAGPIDVLREGRAVRLDASAPRHWAPFVLLGAPR